MRALGLKNLNFSKSFFVLLLLALLFPVLIDFLIIANDYVSKGSNDGWLSFLGGYMGGIATLLAVWVSRKQWQSTEQNQIRRELAGNIADLIGRFITNISKYFYDNKRYLREEKDGKKHTIKLEDIDRQIAVETLYTLKIRLGGDPKAQKLLSKLEYIHRAVCIDEYDCTHFNDDIKHLVTISTDYCNDLIKQFCLQD